MKITVLSAEKVRNSYSKQAIDEYIKRLGTFTKVDFIVDKNPLKKLPQQAYIIEISPKGKCISSEELAQQINDLMLHGNSHIVFVLTPPTDVAADYSLAISRMDMDPEILSIIVFEQIYRAFTIITGRPYHK